MVCSELYQAEQEDITQSCYWWHEAAPRPAPETEWQGHCDIAVIGCGFTGLAAALTLARAGRQVIILEKALIGEGASGRNGGITSGNLRFTPAQLARRFGARKATEFSDEAVAARADLYRFIKDEKLACDFTATGRMLGISGACNLDGLKREADAFAERYGIAPTVISGGAVADYTASPIYKAGVYRPDINGIHPAKLLHEMARLALAAGVRIFSSCPVLSVSRRGAAFHILTEKGVLKANHLISATNGYTDKAQPWLRRRLVPVISEIVVTQTLGANRVRALMPKLSMFGEAKELGYYYRPTPDGTRLLLGGRRMHKNSRLARERLCQGLADIFPELRDVRPEFYWPGFVVFPFDQLPKLAVHDGIIYPTGFCGSGTVWSRWLGQKAALMILGDEAESAFTNMKMHTLPFYTGEPWFLPLAMYYFRLRDRLSGN